MAAIMMHRDVLKYFSKLPVSVQKKLADFVDRFKNDPTDPGIRLHPLDGVMLDHKVRGASLPSGYRAIIIAPEKGDTYLMVHVDKHDEAYAWARNKHFEVHEKTGVFQIFDAELVTEQMPESHEKSQYPLARMSDDDLFQAGVPRPLIPAVHALQSDAALDALKEYLPPDCRDVLHGIAAGMSLDGALKEMLGVEDKAVVSGPGDFTSIKSSPNYDLVVVDGEEALKDILAASLEEWRVFLHPYQRKLVQWKTSGAMSIVGAAGTGKTVALLHRAVYLANTLENAGERVLVTTFTTNLSITFKGYIKKMSPLLAERIEVTNLHSLARTICARAGWKGRIATDEDIADIWADVWATAGVPALPMSKIEMMAEYDIVVDGAGIEDEDGYLTAVRSGRPRITREQRRQAWQIFLSFQRGIKKRNLLTFEGAIHQARLAVEQGRVPKYTHVLADEVQDFSIEALRLIKALSPVDEAKPDPLCMAGDGHQRIYRAKFPMSRAGIEVRGRSRRLKINYRTTEQIRGFAQGLLEGMDIDDLDGGAVTTVADRSIFRGAKPDIISCKDESEEALMVTEWVKELLKDRKFATYEICVTPPKRSIMQALNTAGIATYLLKPSEMDPGAEEPGIRLGSMKRIKGLEFRAVAMACADKNDPINNPTEADIRSRCERYVAATRAREKLLVTTG